MLILSGGMLVAGRGVPLLVLSYLRFVPQQWNHHDLGAVPFCSLQKTIHQELANGVLGNEAPTVHELPCLQSYDPVLALTKLVVGPSENRN
jgi:hypothetical protein